MPQTDAGTRMKFLSRAEIKSEDDELKTSKLSTAIG